MLNTTIQDGQTFDSEIHSESIGMIIGLSTSSPTACCTDSHELMITNVPRLVQNIKMARYPLGLVL